MMYNEFLELSGENYNEITGDYYMNFIEPVYQRSPESMFKDKKDFINWWKKNKEICKWMCEILRSKDNMLKDMKGTQEELKELKKANDNLCICIEKKEEEVDKVKKDSLDSRIKMLEKLEELELKIAFTPDEIVKQIRWEFFDHYEERKQDAISRGIIKN